MKNPKYLLIAASLGFCLSFVIGLFSGVSFIYVFLRAVLFAFIFAAGGIGISLIYSKFLASVSSYSDTDSLKESVNTAGSVVNITIDEDVLPDDELSPKFTVENNRRALGAADLSEQRIEQNKIKEDSINVIKNENSSEKQNLTNSDSIVLSKNDVIDENSNSENVSTEFKPMSLGEISKAPASNAADALDNLPEIGEFSSESNISDSSASSNLDFSSNAPSSSTVSTGSDQNAQVMAQAIRTILANDE